ncbi:Hypothetical predicted protein [Podarcis lilfordi]|uniref:Uncharacterized protein n=1 Tax=Podarcis lilfordi TaxID=74358 RepID=A0AA35KXF3_9SAUR|nr:Hypothetical predicted protein [Podarcis lilfordi]
MRSAFHIDEPPPANEAASESRRSPEERGKARQNFSPFRRARCSLGLRPVDRRPGIALPSQVIRVSGAPLN